MSFRSVVVVRKRIADRSISIVARWVGGKTYESHLKAVVIRAASKCGDLQVEPPAHSRTVGQNRGIAGD